MTSTHTPSVRPAHRARRFLAVWLALPLALLAADPKKTFDVPAGDAITTLKQAAQQAGREIMFPADTVKGVKTAAVQGELTAQEALERMLAGTGLVVVVDAKTGAFSVQRDPNAASRPAHELQPAVKLEDYRVLGSRIRQPETEGPSPVNLYDADYIRSTGAMTLADFLNYLPQNYAGISAGRGSAPNELNPEFGQRTESSFPSFNFVLGAAAAVPGQSGVSGVSLRGLGSGSTLVLVDGRRLTQSGGGNRSTDSQQGFVDLNTIPLGMIERVEITTDGTSAIYGADAVAGVINIVLKKNWVGNELSGSYKGAFHGGGRERSTTLTSGFSAGKLRGSVSLTYYDRADLKASQRAFAKNQNHTGVRVGTDASGNPVYGRDLRLNWGYPAVVQAQGGLVAGNFNALPGVRVVLVPNGAATTPSVAQFVAVTTPVAPSTVVNASGQQRGNTAEFIDLIPASERYGFTGNFTYTFGPALELYGSYAFSDTRGQFNTQPAVSSASATSGFGNFSTLVPAALNPFNQNVIVGLVHYEFGSIWQRTHTKAHNATVGLRGAFGRTWEWDTGLNYQRQDFAQLARNFNGAAITAALNHADPALRLNPFVDARAAGSTQAAVYETMALYPTLDTAARFAVWDFSANGDLLDIWGGPVRMAWGGSYSQSENEVSNVAYSVAVAPVRTATYTSGERDSHAAFAELQVPVFGKPNARPLLRRLEFNLAGRYESYDDAGSTTVPKLGMTWVPVAPLLLRASVSEGYRAPALSEFQVSQGPLTSTLTDPRRTPASTSGVTVTRGSSQLVEPETSTNEFYGVVFEPPFAKGFNLQVNYYRTVQENVIQSLSAQTVVNNEASFAGRITRAAPDATDTALGQPGRLLTVDTTFVNFGEVRNESIDFGIDYHLPNEQLGRWRLSFSATRTLESSRQLAPGQPAIVDDGDTFAPPKWKFNTSVFWNRGPWNAAVFGSYIGSFATNLAGNSFLTFADPSPSVYKIDMRGGYEFRNGVWRGLGKGLRVTAGIGNLLDEEPPFSDTVYGYNGGLHSAYVLGRSYEFSFVLPF